ncbi:arylesterase [Sphingomonas sp. 2R-10]|uniref:arylesterase n=1 Tax=Sphingomonas sp. 2R-10 TaxID=3045148 RepID=UPI000F783CCD|nr:arylesterase [Sphingomonas sp. 2R-10]MDJ0275668.1 arylesterase [Sphingomonas sp. 2R-10]
MGDLSPVTKQGLPYAGTFAILQGALLLGACNQPDLTEGNDAIPVNVAADATPRPVGAQAPVAGPERLVLAFGDSLYAGYGLARGDSLPDDLQDALRADGINARVVNGGISGDTSAAGRQRLAFTLDRLDRKPDLVLLGLGGNDLLRQIPPAETRANFVAMLDELKRRDIPVVLTGMMVPPNLGPDYAAAFNRIWPDMAKRYGATLDPFILAGVIGNRQLMLPDGIHPNAQGVDRIVARLGPVVAERLRP